MSPQIHVMTAASFGFCEHGIEQSPTNALAPSLRKHVDQAQEPRVCNHIAASATCAERLDERHCNRFIAVAADQKPRGGLVTSGVVETGGDLCDACWPRQSFALTAREVRARRPTRRRPHRQGRRAAHRWVSSWPPRARSSTRVWLYALTIANRVRLLWHTSPTPARHAACSSGSAGPPLRPARRPADRDARAPAASGQRRRAWMRLARSLRPCARRA
jgi:hypothetical protein